jgi:hypothetical protein
MTIEGPAHGSDQLPDDELKNVQVPTYNPRLHSSGRQIAYGRSWMMERTAIHSRSLSRTAL